MSPTDTNHETAPPSAGSIERLLAIEEIRRLKAQYWRFVDTKQWDEFGSLFVPDAYFLDHAAPFECSGAAEIQAKISTVLDPALTIHQGHQSEIEVESDSEARGIWAMEDHLIFPTGEVGPSNPYAGATVRGYGHYVEQYVNLDGRWRFQRVELYRLRLEVDSPSSTAYPPVTGAL
jgi:hypothetical protein